MEGKQTEKRKQSPEEENIAKKARTGKGEEENLPMLKLVSKVLKLIKLSYNCRAIQTS